jgi:hypothetical protein
VATKSKSTKKGRTTPSWLTTERVIVGGTIAATVIVLGIIFMSSFLNNQARNTDIEGVEFFPVVGAQHVDGQVNYPQTPPVGGSHNAVWQNCGVYDKPLINEHAVHSLEHGAVWITYQPDLPAEQVARLADITRQSSHRLLSPYPGIDSPVIASAWGYQVRLDSADDPQLMQFILKYEQGPTTPEPGALCSGGTSVTL